MIYSRRGTGGTDLFHSLHFLIDEVFSPVVGIRVQTGLPATGVGSTRDAPSLA